jgi:hypothetical protein
MKTVSITFGTPFELMFWTPIASSAQAGSDHAFIGEPSSGTLAPVGDRSRQTPKGHTKQSRGK